MYENEAYPRTQCVEPFSSIFLLKLLRNHELLQVSQPSCRSLIDGRNSRSSKSLPAHASFGGVRQEPNYLSVGVTTKLFLRTSMFSFAQVFPAIYISLRTFGSLTHFNIVFMIGTYVSNKSKFHWRISNSATDITRDSYRLVSWKKGAVHNPELLL